MLPDLPDAAQKQPVRLLVSWLVVNAHLDHAAEDGLVASANMLLSLLNNEARTRKQMEVVIVDTTSEEEVTNNAHPVPGVRRRHAVILDGVKQRLFAPGFQRHLHAEIGAAVFCRSVAMLRRVEVPDALEDKRAEPLTITLSYGRMEAKGGEKREEETTHVCIERGPGSVNALRPPATRQTK